MGFEEGDINLALNKANGNVEYALDLLLSGNLQVNTKLIHLVSFKFYFPQSEVAYGAVSGDETIIELGISQYTFSDAGSSACTAIAASVVQFILTNLSQNNIRQITNEENLSDCVISGVMKFNELHSSSSEHQHLAVDELGNSFFQSIRGFGEVFQGLLTNRGAFEELIEEARNRCGRRRHIGVVVTKPPETIALVVSGRDNVEQQFFFFDSHSRPEQGFEGSYLVITNDVRKIVERLNRIFPSLAGTDPDNAYSYMYNMFEASFFESL